MMATFDLRSRYALGLARHRLATPFVVDYFDREGIDSMKLTHALIPLASGLALLMVLTSPVAGFAAEEPTAEAKTETPIAVDAKSPTDPATEEETPAPPSLEEVSYAIDNIFLLIAAVLVLFMQAGFAMVETGFNAAKNAVNILFKNLIGKSVV